MTTLNIKNPFNAPVYHEETVESTMDVSRRLASGGEPHGVVITADFQEKGRGRLRGRMWQMERKMSLPFTVLLRFECAADIPPALTLRTGLALLLAVEDFAPSLAGRLKVKWPNDILYGSKKIAGILCEADGGVVHIGIGINFAQKEFPQSLAAKASSVSLAAGIDIDPEKRFCLLEKILSSLYEELENKKADGWKCRLEQRLYKKNENVIFIEGAAGSENKIKGRLAGIGESGELLIIPDGETERRSFFNGELFLG